MTIAAGFVCIDGIVMCADSQESEGDYKFPVEKLVTSERDYYQLAIAGAGIGPLVDMAVGRIIRAFDLNCPKTYYTAEDRISEVLSSLYEKEFALFPVVKNEYRTIDLLVGIKLQGIPKAVLYKTSATSISEVKDYAVVGSGRAVEYQIHKLWHTYEPIRRTIPVAISLLNVASIVLRSVGGSGRIVSLSDKDGFGIGALYNREFETVRSAQNDLESSAGALLLDLLDLGVSEADFSASLTRFTDFATELRTKRVEENEEWVEMLEGLSKAMTKSGKPSKTSNSQTSDDSQ